MFVSKLHGGILKILQADAWENSQKACLLETVAK